MRTGGETLLQCVFPGAKRGVATCLDRARDLWKFEIFLVQKKLLTDKWFKLEEKCCKFEVETHDSTHSLGGQF